MYSINIIVVDNFQNYINNMLTRFRDTRIDISHIVKMNNPIGMLFCYMISGELRICSCAGTERIKPSMEFHPSAMSFFNHKLKRVISWVLTRRTR
ncbi:hypothetical protein D3C78_1466480 [compost metagenome]